MLLIAHVDPWHHFCYYYALEVEEMTNRKQFTTLSVAEVQALQQLRGLLAIVDKALVPVAEASPVPNQMRASLGRVQAHERQTRGAAPLPTPISRPGGSQRPTGAFQYHLKDRRRVIEVAGRGRQDVYQVLQKSPRALTVREVAALAGHPVETTQQILVYFVKRRIAARFHPTVRAKAA